MKDKNCFDSLGVMVDCSRNSVISVDTFKRLVDLLSAMGYNTIQLYTEDTYEVNDEPYFGYMRGRYSKDELKEMDAYSAEKGIELIPCIQTLAHVSQIFQWQPYWEINDCTDILLVGEERTYKLIDNIFATLAECFTSRRVNIGMDEAHMLGLGKYLSKHGYKNRFGIMLEHLKRVLDIAAKYGFRCAMWSDMFFRLAFDGEYYTDGVKEIPAEVLQHLPENVDLIYWDYYSLDKDHYNTMAEQHTKFGNPIIFAGGAWTWLGLTPNNRFSIDATKMAFSVCKEKGIKEVFLTMWGDNGGSCSPFSVLPALFAASEYAKGNFDDDSIKKRFKSFTGVPFDVYMYADLPNMLTEDQEVATKNPSKYLLYNDCLFGIMDSTIDKGAGKIYLSHAEKLKKAERYRQWSFVFKPLRLLCEALYYKADLGIRTREAYQNGDREMMRELIDSAYKPLIKKIREFYKEFSIYWETLFKPHGFEVMDYRVGGLIQRLLHVVEKLSAYTSGKTDRITELEEKLLDFFGNGEKLEKSVTAFNLFNRIITVNNL